MASSFAAMGRDTVLKMTQSCGPGCSTWPGRFATPGKPSPSRSRSIRNRSSTGHAGCAAIAGRLAVNGKLIGLLYGDKMDTQRRIIANKGFTLIELSIVMAIIGLMVGGVLVGRDMIHAAEVRATVSDIEKLKTSINAFQIKYNCLPGDCPKAQFFFGASGVCPDVDANGTCNGDGNGNYFIWPNETKWATDQLILSQLWPEDRLVGTGYTQRFNIRGPHRNTTAYIFTNDLYYDGSGQAPINDRWGNTITLTGQSGPYVDGVILTAMDAQIIDGKLDDGYGSKGTVFGLPGNTFSDPGNPPGAVDNNCLISGDYNVISNDNQEHCRMLFYW